MKTPESIEQFVARKTKERARALANQAAATARLTKLDQILDNPEYHYQTYLKNHKKNHRRLTGTPSGIESKPPEDTPITPAQQVDEFGDPLN